MCQPISICFVLELKTSSVDTRSQLTLVAPFGALSGLLWSNTDIAETNSPRCVASDWYMAALTVLPQLIAALGAAGTTTNPTATMSTVRAPPTASLSRFSNLITHTFVEVIAIVDPFLRLPPSTENAKGTPPRYDPL
jgi:hypothetical protein